MDMKNKYRAFTLVELIVVITILAILATIAFISLQWYSADARDSTRISDISSMKTSLELYNLDSWKYPSPTNWVNITYSGWIVWNQWKFWETVFANVVRLDKIPKDPLTDKEYTFSVTSNRFEYQLWWIMESDTISMNNLNKWYEVNAWDIEATAYVAWNYNSIMAKTYSGATCNVLWVPTIITNDTNVTDLQQIINNNSFVYWWYNNLPSTFKDSKFKYDWGFPFTPNNVLAYTDTGSCSELTSTTSSGTQARVSLIKWLQDSYSGTILSNEWTINNIVNLSINVSNPSSEVVSFASNFVNNVLWSNIVSSSSTSSSSWWPWVKTILDCTTGWQVLYSTVDWTDTWLTCSDDIFVCTWNQTWYIVSACNVWASWSANDFNNCTNTSNCTQAITGYYYQWWRNKAFWNGWLAIHSSTIPWTVWLNAWTDTYWFVTNGSFSNWANTDIKDNWWAVTNTNIARQWPCPSWYHIPDWSEWQWVCNSINGSACVNGMALNANYPNKLKLPKAWHRYWANTSLDQWSGGAYWSSTTQWSVTVAYSTSFSASQIYPNTSVYMTYWYPVRCFKN